MRTSRPFVASVIVLLIGAALAPAVGADTLTVTDPANDVAGQESGNAQSEPRVDIIAIDVDHQSRSLDVRITVAQVVPLDDDAWDTGQLQLAVALSERGGSSGTGAPDFLWSLIPDGGGGATGDLSSFAGDSFFACTTQASVDIGAEQYIFSAGPECLSRVPRSIAVQSVASFNPQPDNFDFFDYSVDVAPDSAYTAKVATGASAPVTRVAGPDRVDTAIAISNERFDDGSAVGAVLVSSENFPDAIAGGPLAVAQSGPLLLNGPDGLDPRVEAELTRVLPPGSDVFLLGGTGVLSPAVITGLSRAGFHPRRVAGANRFETAVSVAGLLGHDLVVIADGRGFREALIAASVAASLGGVVVLTDGETLPTATDDFLAHDSTRHLAIGTAARAAAGAERITAASPADLAVKVIDRLMPNVRIIGVASQATYADALASVPQLAALGGGLLLSDAGSLTTATSAELVQRRDDLREVLLYGGTGAISTATEDQIVDALSSSS